MPRLWPHRFADDVTHASFDPLAEVETGNRFVFSDLDAMTPKSTDHSRHDLRQSLDMIQMPGLNRCRALCIGTCVVPCSIAFVLPHGPSGCKPPIRRVGVTGHNPPALRR